MINEYKKFLKENREFFFLYVTGCGIAMGILFTTVGCVATVSVLTKHNSNTKKLNAYRENLATFQKCAEKVTDASLVESYCGRAPNEPILIW